MSNAFVEELEFGDCFFIDSKYYVLGIDYRKDGKRLCISLIDGSPRWFEGNSIVEKIQIYTMDKDSIIIPIKETKKDADYKTKDVS